MTLAHDFRFVLGARNDNHQFKRSAAGIAEMLLPYVRPSAKKGSVRIRFHPLTPETDFDYANLSGSVWFHPDDVSQRSDMNFYDIVEQAQIWSTQLMELFAGEVTQKGSADFQLFTMGIDFNGRHSE